LQGLARSSHNRTVTVARIVVGALTLAGCWGNTSTEFPDGLEPLEDNTAPEQDGPYEERLDLVDGEDHDYDWVHSRGYIAVEPGALWNLMKEPERMLSRCSTDSHTVEIGVEPDYEFGFQVSHVVEEVITLEWDELWRYGTIDGSTAAPSLAIVRYQKVYGSELIQRIEGSVQLHATRDPEVSELQMIEHVAAAGGGVDDIRASMQYR
jgi:hypothetical protein